jgi:hypothetical protein
MKNLFVRLATVFFCGAVLATSSLWLRSSWALQKPTPLEKKTLAPYIDPDAYDAYALAMPPANKMFVVAEPTLGIESTLGVDECIHNTQEFGGQFESALANFKDLNRSPKRLVGRWPVQKQVDVISDADLAKFTKRKKFNWDAFYKRYPLAIGVFRFSEVGFNTERTTAIFYRSISGGGGFMGDGGFFVLKKINGNWEQQHTRGANYCIELH